MVKSKKGHLELSSSKLRDRLLNSLERRIEIGLLGNYISRCCLESCPDESSRFSEKFCGP